MALSKLAVRRLTKLADFLQELPRDKAHRFDMFRTIKETDCGTSACALGWAYTIPAFRKAGLERPNAFGYVTVGATFFDIHHRESNALFSAFDIHTPKQWARHCRKFIRDNA